MLANLKTALSARRMRQVDLAVDLRISPALLSEVIHGRSQLAPHLKTRAAEILKADEGWLFTKTRVIPPLKPSGEIQSSAAAE